MKNFKLLFVILCLFVICGLAQAQTAPPYSINAIKVNPFNHENNSFTGDLEADNKGNFFNALDTSLFISVEVTGQKGSYEGNRKVEITAYSGKKLISKVIGRLGVLDGTTGKYYCVMWLQGPQCQDLTIQARMLGQAKASSKQRTLSFICGE